MGKGIIDEHSPYSLGTAALSDHDYLHCAIERADVIINVGHDVVEKPPFFMNQRDVTVVHVNYAPADIDEVYFPQHEVIGDIGTSLSQLLQLIHDPAAADNDYFQRLHAEIN